MTNSADTTTTGTTTDENAESTTVHELANNICEHDGGDYGDVVDALLTIAKRDLYLPDYDNDELILHKRITRRVAGLIRKAFLESTRHTGHGETWAPIETAEPDNGPRLPVEPPVGNVIAWTGSSGYPYVAVHVGLDVWDVAGQDESHDWAGIVDLYARTRTDLGLFADHVGIVTDWKRHRDIY